MAKFSITRKGESLPFLFDRGNQTIAGWICTIKVRVFPFDTALISRVISPVNNAWPGFLTSTETTSLALNPYRLVGVLTNATTDEEEQVILRFNVTATWAAT